VLLAELQDEHSGWVSNFLLSAVVKGALLMHLLLSDKVPQCIVIQRELRTDNETPSSLVVYQFIPLSSEATKEESQEEDQEESQEEDQEEEGNFSWRSAIAGSCMSILVPQWRAGAGHVSSVQPRIWAIRPMSREAAI